MTVYLDDWRQLATIRGRTERWSHLIGDSREELQDFAAMLGVPPRAFQDHAWRWHYDVPESFRAQVVALGAEPVGWRDVGLMLRARRRSMRDPLQPGHCVVLSGVSGVGKSTVGRVLAMRLGVEFLDADRFHSPDAVARMGRGEPLTDQMRAPWLEDLNAELRVRADLGTVLACSALTRSSRSLLLADAPDIALVHLEAPREVLEHRLATRTGHFAGPALLPSQIDTEELPDDALRIDTLGTVTDTVERIVGGLPQLRG